MSARVDAYLIKPSSSLSFNTELKLAREREAEGKQYHQSGRSPRLSVVLWPTRHL